MSLTVKWTGHNYNENAQIADMSMKRSLFSLLSHKYNSKCATFFVL